MYNHPHNISCRICWIDDLHLLAEDEQVIALDVEQSASIFEQFHFVVTFVKLLGPFIRAGKVCFNGARFVFRATKKDRLAFGRDLQGHAEKSGSRYIQIFAKLFLEEGAFEPERFRQLSGGEVCTLGDSVRK